MNQLCCLSINNYNLLRLMELLSTFHNTCKFCGRFHQWQLQQIRSSVGGLTLRVPAVEIQECLKYCCTLYFALIAGYHQKYQLGGLEALKSQLDSLIQEKQDIFSYFKGIVQEVEDGIVSFLKTILVKQSEKNSLKLIKEGLNKIIQLDAKSIVKLNILQRNQILGFESLEGNTNLSKILSKGLALGLDDVIESNDYWPSDANQLKIHILKQFQYVQKCYSRKFADSSTFLSCRGCSIITSQTQYILLVYSSQFGQINDGPFSCMDKYDKICQHTGRQNKQLLKSYERLIGWFVFLDMVVADIKFSPQSMVRNMGGYLVQNLVPINVRRQGKKIERKKFVDRMTQIILCYYQNRTQGALRLEINLYKIFEILYKELPKNQIPNRIRRGLQFIEEVIEQIQKMHKNQL